MENDKRTPVDYRVEHWPDWAQREFWLRFYVNYLPKYVLAHLTGRSQTFEEDKSDWSVPLYDDIFSRVEKAATISGSRN